MNWQPVRGVPCLCGGATKTSTSALTLSKTKPLQKKEIYLVVLL